MMPTAKIEKVIARAANEYTETWMAAEALLEAKSQGQTIDPSSELIFRWLGWDEKRVTRELARVVNASRLKGKAGTNSQLAEAVEVAEALKLSVPAEIDAIESKISELVGKKSEALRKLGDAKRRVEEYEWARAELRNNIPAFVREKFEKELNLFQTGEFASNMRELQSRRTHIVGVLENLSEVNSDTIRQIVLLCESQLPDALSPANGDFHSHKVNEHKWQAFLNGYRKELDQINAALPPIVAEYETRCAEIESLLDFYLEVK